MIPASGAGGPGFESRNGPFVLLRCPGARIKHRKSRELNAGIFAIFCKIGKPLGNEEILAT